MTSDAKISSTLKKPAAFLPIGMSLIAFGVVVAHVAVFGVAREADEGAAAHLWQLLMAGQAPIVAFFLMTSLTRAPRAVLMTLALQVGAALLAAAPVYLFRL